MLWFSSQKARVLRVLSLSMRTSCTRISQRHPLLTTRHYAGSFVSAWPSSLSCKYSTLLVGINSLKCQSIYPQDAEFIQMKPRYVSTKQRRKWKIRKYHFKLRLKRTMRKMRVPYVSSKARGQVKKKPILFDFRPNLRRKLKRAER